MSSFKSIINEYCNTFQVSLWDKAKILLHYPLFRCIHTLDYGKRNSQQHAAKVYPLIKNHRLHHSIKCASGKIVRIDLPFDRYDIGSFREVLMGECYRLPKEAFNIEVIIDLGGNTGMASLYYLTRLPNAHRVIIVEANPNLIPIINANLSAFYNQIKVENVCIGKISDTYVNFRIDANHRHSHIGVTDQMSRENTVRVPNLTLRQLMDKHGIARADLLKMDIEGAEFSVLEDGDVLQRFRFMHVEIHGNLDQRNKFVQRVQDLGFVLSERSDVADAPCEQIFAASTKCLTY